MCMASSTSQTQYRHWRPGLRPSRFLFPSVIVSFSSLYPRRPRLHVCTDACTGEGKRGLFTKDLPFRVTVSIVALVLPYCPDPRGQRLCPLSFFFQHPVAMSLRVDVRRKFQS